MLIKIQENKGLSGPPMHMRTQNETSPQVANGHRLCHTQKISGLSCQEPVGRKYHPGILDET